MKARHRGDDLAASLLNGGQHGRRHLGIHVHQHAAIGLVLRAKLQVGPVKGNEFMTVLPGGENEMRVHFPLGGCAVFLFLHQHLDLLHGRVL